jgi:hypothetical protein
MKNATEIFNLGSKQRALRHFGDRAHLVLSSRFEALDFNSIKYIIVVKRQVVSADSSCDGRCGSIQCNSSGEAAIAGED